MQDYNLAPSSFNLARDIWESDSLNDDLDFYVPEFKSNRRKNLKWNKARYFGIKKL